MPMPKLRRVSGKEAIRALERLGFERVRQRGSHVVLKKQTPEGAVGCVVPLHRELAIGTLRGILRQARITPDEFMENLWRTTAERQITACLRFASLTQMPTALRKHAPC